MKPNDESVRHLFPPHYITQIKQMAAAGSAWLASSRGACLNFAPLEAHIMYIGGLDRAIEWWGLNAPTRELLRVMDKASGEQATIMMAQCALEMMFEPQGHA